MGVNESALMIKTISRVVAACGERESVVSAIVVHSSIDLSDTRHFRTGIV